ncbi:MAG: protein translocase SEC61 complex subunit gamma [Nitrososphaerota archaeon]|nr:protein translocase SEC61 complex subunit gamma [Aigarchaeota archaeon]MDW8076571.1 protein translocase SEC61 complex subunit gamma [Nitrososphaerota archaeon]
MKLIEFFKSVKTLMKVAKKPTRAEFITALKITFLGIVLLGVIAFIVRFVALALQTI